ncbi:MAG: hypothetical protein ACJ8GN_24235 [Longimicrobiaceae bacterium]
MSKIEEWAKQIIARELNREVEVHDDGTQPGMYDLRVGPVTAPQIAIECVGAVDPIRTETWNIGPARGPLWLKVAGDWHVEVKPNASIKAISRRLEASLLYCEEQGLLGFLPVDWLLERHQKPLFAELSSLGIKSIHCFRPSGRGEVHLGMTGMSGAVDTHGTGLPNWIAEFLRAPERSDVFLKLGRSGAQECHVFVPVSFGGAGWAVESYLERLGRVGREIESVPSVAPDLPPPVNAVWITNSANGLRWNGLCWRLFSSVP